MSEKIPQQMIDQLALQPVRLPETDRTTIPMGGRPIMSPVQQASGCEFISSPTTTPPASLTCPMGVE